jgi:hypothetical protein
MPGQRLEPTKESGTNGRLVEKNRNGPTEGVADPQDISVRMDRKFKLGDPVNIIRSERGAVVNGIDTGFGVAVYSVRFDDQPASHQWFAAHELVPRARNKLVSRWVLVIAGIVDYGLGVAARSVDRLRKSSHRARRLEGGVGRRFL